MTKIRYEKGNVLDATEGQYTLIPHVVNDIGLFGAGFALGISDKYPEIQAAYFKGHKNGEIVLGNTQFVAVDDQPGPVFANMVSQKGVRGKDNPKPIKYLYLEVSMKLVATYAREEKIPINTVMFGCGLAGGSWIKVEQMIKQHWKDLDVTIWEL